MFNITNVNYIYIYVLVPNTTYAFSWDIFNLSTCLFETRSVLDIVG